jgi:hypothetical protein
MMRVSMGGQSDQYSSANVKLFHHTRTNLLADSFEIHRAQLVCFLVATHEGRITDEFKRIREDGAGLQTAEG